MNKHAIERVRHELRMRKLIVQRIQALSPQMIRVTLSGPDLAGFKSAAPDDHVKVFFPVPGTDKLVLPAGPPGTPMPDGAPRPTARDYTPRRYDPVAQELDLDFVLHGHGPAASWAAQAKVGQTLGVGGPRGSQVVADDFDWYLLIADETGLPAIGRRLDEMRPEARVTVIAEVQSPAEEQSLKSRAPLTVRWLHRGESQAGEPARLLEAALAFEPPSGDGYVWIACESHVARAIRAHLVEERGFNKAWIKAAGYWKRGEVATHENHSD